MTSEEIEKSDFIHTFDESFWLKEIAYQLAVMNEREDLRVARELAQRD